MVTFDLDPLTRYLYDFNSCFFLIGSWLVILYRYMSHLPPIFLPWQKGRYTWMVLGALKTQVELIIFIILEVFTYFKNHVDFSNNNCVIKTGTHQFALNNLCPMRAWIIFHPLPWERKRKLGFSISYLWKGRKHERKHERIMKPFQRQKEKYPWMF